MKEATIENIMRWIPFELKTEELVDMLRNKMIRPTTIPHTLESLVVEHAVAREALRLGLQHHKTIATRLKGAKIKARMVGEVMESHLKESYLEMMKINIIAGTGGLLSHAPLRVQSMLALTDAFLPEGVTKIYQDSVFMMPHLGVLSTAFPDIAWNIFDKDCLVRLGTVLAPVGTMNEGEPAINVSMEMPDGKTLEKEINFYDIIRIPLKEREKAKITIQPKQGLDIGEGSGKILETTVEGGVVGVIIDARGRPLILPEETDERKRTLLRWLTSLDVYPEKFLNQFMS